VLFSAGRFTAGDGQSAVKRRASLCASHVPKVTLCRVAGYRRSPLRETATPNYSLNTHAPDQTDLRPQRLHCDYDLTALDRAYHNPTPFS